MECEHRQHSQLLLQLGGKLRGVEGDGSVLDATAHLCVAAVAAVVQVDAELEKVDSDLCRGPVPKAQAKGAGARRYKALNAWNWELRQCAGLDGGGRKKARGRRRWQGHFVVLSKLVHHDLRYSWGCRACWGTYFQGVLVPRTPQLWRFQQVLDAADDLRNREGNAHRLCSSGGASDTLGWSLLPRRTDTAVCVHQARTVAFAAKGKINNRQIRYLRTVLTWQGMHRECGCTGQHTRRKIAIHLLDEGHIAVWLRIIFVTVEQVHARELVHYSTHAARHRFQLHAVHRSIIHQRIDLLLNLEQLRQMQSCPVHQNGWENGPHQLTF
mmetsp:Transcript_39974/g.69210  ORF Transcript_39974/g.69210 Transcript_39974/m.69210 type:complete len:326 (-) Transcript_39974:2338-3315(-)